MVKKQIGNDKEKKISLLFIIFFFSAGVVLFVGLLAFDIQTVLIGGLLCNVYAPFVYCLPDKIKLNTQLRFLRQTIYLNSSLCITGIIICYYLLFSYTPPVTYLGIL